MALAAAATVLSTGALVASSGLMGGDAGGPGNIPQIRPPPPLEPEPGQLAEYRSRCERMNRGGAQARIDYEKRRDMTRGDTEVVKAAVTLNQTVPPRKVLDRVGAEGVPGIVVSCSLQARITASRYEFDIEQNGWVPRSLLATDTARWAWDVTPKVGGQHTIVLSVRPIAVQEEPLDDSTQILASEEDANVQQYEINVAVNVPWTERPAEFMTQVAATLAVAEEVVKAFTALIVAGAVLLGALGIRRSRRRRAER